MHDIGLGHVNIYFLVISFIFHLMIDLIEGHFRKKANDLRMFYWLR